MTKYQMKRNINTAYVEDLTEFVVRKCKCGHTLSFLEKHPRTCGFCGRLVYPTKELEFKEKLKREMRKNEQSFN